MSFHQILFNFIELLLFRSFKQIEVKRGEEKWNLIALIAFNIHIIYLFCYNSSLDILLA